MDVINGNIYLFCYQKDLGECAELSAYSGQVCTVVRWDSFTENHNLYKVRFSDGSTYEVFEEELVPCTDTELKIVREVAKIKII